MHISAQIYKKEDFLVVVMHNIASPYYLEQTKQPFFGMVRVRQRTELNAPSIFSSCPA